MIAKYQKIEFTPFIIILVGLLLKVSFSGTVNTDINGYVVDKNSGEALPHANVTVKDMVRGTTTNQDGYFVLVDMPDTAISLEIFYIGYETKSVMAKGGETITIKMEEIFLQGRLLC